MVECSANGLALALGTIWLLNIFFVGCLTTVGLAQVLSGGEEASRNAENT